MNTINNNTGNVWAAIGKGAVIGAAATTTAASLGIKRLAKNPDRFISMMAENATRHKEVFNESFAKDALKLSGMFKHRLGMGLLLAPVGAAVGAVLGGTVGAITKGVKSIVNHSKAKADNQAAQV